MTNTTDCQIASDVTPPDWSQIDYDVYCPLCEYNLRGLTVPRCPECGYRFDWNEALNPKRQMHTYLFEHHPERNVWSYVKTTLGAWRPRRFWTSLHPTQPSRPTRLLIYWWMGVLLLLPMMSLLIVCQCGLGAVSSSIGRKTVLAEIQANNARHQRIIATYGSVAVYMNRWYPRLTTFGLIQNHFANLDVTSLRSQTYMAIWLAPVWAWLTLAVLMLFQISMARAHIKVIHVLRCVLYSFDIPLWAVVITTGSLIILLSCQWLPRSYWPTGHPLGFAFGLFVNSITILFGLCIALGAYRLYMAYRWYLRFDRPLATVLATQFIALLCTVLVLELTAPQISYELYRFLGLLPH